MKLYGCSASTVKAAAGPRMIAVPATDTLPSASAIGTRAASMARRTTRPMAPTATGDMFSRS